MKTLNNSLALEIKYIGPTNTRGSRIKITSYDVAHKNNKKSKSIIISWDYTSDDINEIARNYIQKVSPKMKIIAQNCNNPKHNILIYKWDWESVCKLFKIEVV